MGRFSNDPTGGRPGDSDKFGVDIGGVTLGANIPSIGRSGDALDPDGTVGESTETVKKEVKNVTNEVRNIGPDYLDEAAIGLVGLVGLGVFAYVFGQLFTVEL